MTAHTLHSFHNLQQFSRIGRVGTRVVQSVLKLGCNPFLFGVLPLNLPGYAVGGYAPVRMVIIHRRLVGANNLSGVALFLALVPELIYPILNLLPRHATRARLTAHHPPVHRGLVSELAGAVGWCSAFSRQTLTCLAPPRP